MKTKTRSAIVALILLLLPVALATGAPTPSVPPGAEECFPKESVLQAFENAGFICMEKDEYGTPVKRGEYRFVITTDDAKQKVTSVKLRESKETTLAELNCIANVLRETKWDIEPHCIGQLDLRRSNRPPTEVESELPPQ